MIFDEFIQKIKAKWETLAKEILGEAEKEYDAFWREMLEELQREKLTLERENEKLMKLTTQKNEEVEKLSTELIKTSEAVKEKQETLKKYETQKNLLFDEIVAIEEREKNSKSLLEELKAKEIELSKKEDELRLEKGLLEEREKRAQRIWDKVH